MMQLNGRIRVSRRRRLGVILSLGLWGVLGVTPGRSAPDSCTLPMFVEVQSVSTNRVKSGHAGFWSRTNSSGNGLPRFYRTNAIEVSEQIQMVGPQFAYGSALATTQWTVFPTQPGAAVEQDEWGCPMTAPYVMARTGWVQHGGSYISGCDECEATLFGDEWGPDAGCPDCHAALVADATRNWGLTCTGSTNETQLTEVCFYQDAGGSGAFTYSHYYWKRVSQTLSGEYTTGMLLADLRQDLAAAPWPGRWSSQGLARLHLSPLESCAEATRLRYRIRFIGNQGEAGEVEWTERFTPAGGGPVQDRHRRVTVLFTGDEQTLEGVIEPPDAPGTIGVITAPWQTCSGCGLGQADLALRPGPWIRLSLGQHEFGSPSGFLYLAGAVPRADLATPKALKAFAPSEVVELLTHNSALRQVRTAHALVDIQDAVEGGVDIAFHLSAGPKDAETGLYEPLGVPLARWTLARISDRPYTLRVLRSDHGQDDFVYSEGSWTLRREGEPFVETSRSTWDETGTVLTITSRYVATGSVALGQETRIYTVQPDRPVPVLTRQIIGGESSALTNLWFYHDTLPASHVNYGKLRMILRAGGAWERYEYDPDDGRLRKIVSGFGNSLPDGPETQCRVRTYDYAPLHPSDHVDKADDTPRTEVEFLCGVEVARDYRICTSAECREIQCQTPGASWDAPDNLVTVRKTLALTNGLEERVRHWDGTTRLVRWETNAQARTFTRTTEHGQPADDPDQPALLSGTREAAAHDSNGLTIAWIRTDIASGVLLANRRMHYDALHRLVRDENLVDGTDAEYGYDCCSLSWSRDATGTIRNFTYDRRHQLQTVSQHGVTFSNCYHSPGLIAAQWRVGTDGSLIRLGAYQYDLAGRRTAQTNALHHVTRYFYGTDPSGCSFVKTVHPDGAWETQLLNRDGSPAESAGNAVFPARHVYGIEHDGGVARPFEEEIRLQDGQATERTKALFDMVGRPYKTIYASPPDQAAPVRESFFNRKGQLERETDPDGVTRLFTYDASGALELTGLDRDGDGRLAPDGSDRLEKIQTQVTAKHGTFVQETLRWSWPSNGVDRPILHSCVDRSVDGLHTWIVQGGVTNHLEIRHDSPTIRRVSVTAADGTSHVLSYQNGRLSAAYRLSAAGQFLAMTNYGYDAHGRCTLITDRRGDRVTGLYYDAADQVVSNVLSVPDLPLQVTVYRYDARGRLDRVDWPDGTFTSHQFYPDGQVQRSGGNRTRGAEYAYDKQGRLTTLRTWREPADPASAAVTTWLYDPYRGFLVGKLYPDGKGPRYRYTPAGRLSVRTDPRGTRTVYLYDRVGDLVAKKHSDTTAKLAFFYDRSGRLRAVVQGNNSTQLSYSGSGRLVEERINGGLLAGWATGAGYDGCQRLASVTLGSPPLVQTTYAYTPDSRVAQVTSGSLAIRSEHGPSPLPATNLVFSQNHRITFNLARTYDTLGRLREILFLPAQGAAAGLAYQYDAGGRRIRAGNLGGAFWTYEYDRLGQILAASQYWADGHAVAGRRFRYAYDHLGNRTQAGHGGNPWGHGLHFDHYAANDLNQYEHRDVAGILGVSGTAHPDATVFVNDRPAHRRTDYYWAEVPVVNAAQAAYVGVTNLAVLRERITDLEQTITGYRFLPGSPEAFVYDANGNLVQDGRWSYGWDAENRLISMESLAGAPARSRRRLDFAYDWHGRRILKRTCVWKEGAWLQISELRFLYHGWQLVAEVGEDDRPVRTYIWGADQSGTPGGVAGVGGLLAVQVWSNQPTDDQTLLCAADVSGHVVGLIRAADGSWAGEYEYGPYGEPLRVSGASAAEHPFRFSTRYLDRETGLVYSGHRYYSPATGRWLSRDPMEEEGGLNLYGYVENDPVQGADPLGLEMFSSITVKRKQVLWLALLKAGLGKKPAPDDPYGHWWIEFDGESYGWWPEEGVTLIQTLTGVPGSLNGTLTMHAQGLASATRDGHHGDRADLEFHPRRRSGPFAGRKIKHGQAEGKHCRCVEEEEIKDCLRAFARQYTGSWSYPWGQNCHSFHRSALRSCCLKP